MCRAWYVVSPQQAPGGLPDRPGGGCPSEDENLSGPLTPASPAQSAHFQPCTLPGPTVCLTQNLDVTLGFPALSPNTKPVSKACPFHLQSVHGTCPLLSPSMVTAPV